jgi:hypothetical protein
MMLSNRSGFVVLSLAALLTFSLAACKEEKAENMLSVHEDVLLAHDETKNGAEKINEKDNVPGAASNEDCKRELGNVDIDSVREIAPNVLQARTEGSSGCRDKEMVTSMTEGPNYELKMEAGYEGESGTTNELLLNKNEFSTKNGDDYWQRGGEWPDNEFSREFLRWLPKPNMPLESLAFKMKNKDFGIIFKEATLDQMKGYAEQVKKRGFTINAKTKDRPDLSLFVYEAKNPEGYIFKMTCVGNCVLGLDGPKN